MKAEHEIAREQLQALFASLGYQTTITGGQLAEEKPAKGEKRGWMHHAYKVGFQFKTTGGPAETIAFDWKQGTGCKEKPDPAEVLARVCEDYQSAKGRTFEDWAGEYGYDTDSRAAEKIFRACMAQGEKLARLGVSDEMQQKLAELACQL